MNFFDALNELKTRILNFRNDLNTRNKLITKKSDIISLSQQIDDFLSEINNKCNLYDLEDFKCELLEYFNVDIQYFNFLNDTIKIVNSNSSSLYFNVENDLLEKSFKIGDINIKLFDIERKSKGSKYLENFNDVMIDKNFLDEYKSLINTKKYLIYKYDEIVKKLRNNDNFYCCKSIKDDIKKYQDELDSIINCKKKKRNKWITVDDKKFHIPKELCNRFKYLYNVVNNLDEKKTIPQDDSLVIKDSIFIVKNNNRLYVPNNMDKYNGLISVDDDNVNYYQNDIGKIYNQDVVQYQGFIKVDDNIDDNVVLSYSDFYHKKKDENNNKKALFKILNKRKPNNKNILKKNLIKSSIAIVLSLVTSLSVVNSIKRLFNYNVGNTVSSISNEMVFNDDRVSYSNNELQKKEEVVKSNTTKNVILNQSNEIIEKEKNEKNVVVTLNTDLCGDNLSNEIIDYNIGDKVTILKNNNKIFSSFDDAISNCNGLHAYYDYDEVRQIEYMALKVDNSIRYCYTQEEVEYLKSKGATVDAVCTSVVDGSPEGFYKVKQLVKN